MHVSKRLTVGLTALAVTFVTAPAFAGGHGGGGGGGGSPGTKPYIEFAGGGAFSVTEGTANAVIKIERVPKGADAVNFSTNGSPDGAVGGADCSNPATDYIVQNNVGISIGTNGVGTALVPICDNNFFENSETVNLLLSQRTTTPVGGKITGTLTIADNDKAPVLSIDNKSGVEGSTQTFTVTASTADPLLPMSVHWSTSDGTATVADGDYAAQSGDVAIAPGNTTTTFTVTSIDDSVYEPGPAQYFWVNLSAPVNSSISPTQGSGKDTLTDNDSAPFVTVDNNPTVVEGNTLQFTLKLSGLSDVAATGTVDTWPGNTPDLRYSPSGDTAWTISAGSTTTTFSVPTTDNNLPESDATVWSHILTANNAQINTSLACGDYDCTPLGTDDAWGYGTIQDNDNGGFETGDLTGWLTYTDGTGPAPVVVTSQAHGGTHSVQLGKDDNGGLSGDEPSGTTAVYRNITVPATGTTTLSSWVFESGDNNGVDDQFAQIKDATTFAVLATYFDDGSAYNHTWQQKTIDLTPYAGQTIQVIWAVYEDGAGASTAMYVDDVQVTHTP